VVTFVSVLLIKVIDLGDIRMNIRPLQDRVVVRRMEEETTTAGGIVLPGSATEKPAQGEVVAVGSGKRHESGETQPVDVKVGDIVVFGKYSSNTVKIGDEELLILNESEIFGVIES
jgi:chaperonin GroES|tara:strand:- start:183 stop:530 length:348 start_codon:yes stop_codon:yes gene_type:complete